MILSPQSLWKEYKREEMPLEETVIATTQANGTVTKLVYFNGEVSPRGCTRIFARLIVPKDADKAIIILPDHKDDVFSRDFEYFTNAGYAVLIPDYAGNVFDRERFTIYPMPLKFANYNATTLFDVPLSPQSSCWYVWTTVAMRSIFYMETLGYTKICMFGIGYGGAQALKCATLCPTLVCAASLYSPGFFPPTDDPTLLTVSASIDNAGYVPSVKVPFFMLCCSNDGDGSLNEINEMCLQPNENVGLYIEPRASHSETVHLQHAIHAFFDGCVKGDLPFERYATTSLSVVNGEGKLFYTLKGDKAYASLPPIDTSAVTLYVAHGIENPAYRNWRAINMKKVGEREYIGTTEVYSDKPVYAFGCIQTADGFLYSTTVLKTYPAKLGIRATPTEKVRLIYDSDMGTDDFFTDDPLSLPQIKTGPFGIRGVAAAHGLNTYKIGDALYSGARDDTLQLLLFSPTPQDVTVSVIDGDAYVKYSITTHVRPEDDWHQVSVSASDFKSDYGALSGFDKAIFLQITAESEVLVNTLLWV